MSTDTVDWQALQEPLSSKQIEWRVQKSGEKDGRPWAMVVPYPDARALMDRLDSVIGPANWRTDYIAGPAGGVICSLSIRVGDEWVAKEDGAENTEIEAVKGGLTTAFRRVCVHWNVGGIRALYRVGTCWADISKGGEYRDKTKDGTWFNWDPPELDWTDLDGAPLANGDRTPPATKKPQTEPPAGPEKDKGKSRQQARQRYVAECAKHFEEPEDAREFAAFLVRFYAHERPDVPLDGKLWRAEHFEAATKWLAEQGEDGVADVLSWQMDAESEEPELFEGQGA